jgi:hypothetical protein
MTQAPASNHVMDTFKADTLFKGHHGAIGCSSSKFNYSVMGLYLELDGLVWGVREEGHKKTGEARELAP